MNIVYTLLLALFIWLFYQSIKENRVEGFSLPGELPLGTRMHIRLTPNGDALYESPQQPSQNGELGCTQVPCPAKFSDNKTCWCCCNYH